MSRRNVLFVLVALAAVFAIGYFAVFHGYSEVHLHPVFAVDDGNVEYTFDYDSNVLTGSTESLILFVNGNNIPDTVLYYNDTPNHRLIYCVSVDGSAATCHSIRYDLVSGRVPHEFSVFGCGRYLYFAYYYITSRNDGRWYEVYSHLRAYSVDVLSGRSRMIVRKDYKWYRSLRSDYESGITDIDILSYGVADQYPVCGTYLSVGYTQMYSDDDWYSYGSHELSFYMKDGAVRNSIDYVYYVDEHTSCTRNDVYRVPAAGWLQGHYYRVSYHWHNEYAGCSNDYGDDHITIYRDNQVILTIPGLPRNRQMYLITPYLRGRVPRYVGLWVSRNHVTYLMGSVDLLSAKYYPGKMLTGPYFTGYSTQLIFLVGNTGPYVLGTIDENTGAPVAVSGLFNMPRGVLYGSHIYSCDVDASDGSAKTVCRIYRAPPITYDVDVNVIGILDYDNNVSEVPVALHAVPVYDKNLFDSHRVVVYLDGNLYRTIDVNAPGPLDINVFVGTPGVHRITFATLSPTTTVLTDYNVDAGNPYPSSETYAFFTATVRVLSKPYDVMIYKVVPQPREVYLAATAVDDDVNSPVDLNYTWRLTFYRASAPPVEVNVPTHTPSLAITPASCMDLNCPDLNTVDYVTACVTVTDPKGLATTKCGDVDITKTTDNEPVIVVGPPVEVIRKHRRILRVPIEVVPRLYANLGISVRAPSLPSGLSAVPISQVAPVVGIATVFGIIAFLVLH